MYEYDRVKMVHQGSGFVCVENVPVMELLSEVEDSELAQSGFVFREIDENEVHIIVNRLDVASLNKAVTTFQTQYSEIV